MRVGTRAGYVAVGGSSLEIMLHGVHGFLPSLNGVRPGTTKFEVGCNFVVFTARPRRSGRRTKRPLRTIVTNVQGTISARRVDFRFSG